MTRTKQKLAFEDGNRIAVMGAGPAGSFFSYFVLSFAARLGLQLYVDVYEPRDFSMMGPAGCNMCGGIVSESLLQSLALEGIELPDSVVQRGIDSYTMHTEAGSCLIETPTKEKRIAAVHRGGGPRTAKASNWRSFDGHLLQMAVAQGARLKRTRVRELRWNDGHPEIQLGQEPAQVYDLLVGAIGVNSPELKLFENLGFGYRRPRTVKTFITEFEFGSGTVKELFGSSMHVFLLDLKRLDFAALIPKGDFVTLCMLGSNIDKELVTAFLQHTAVRRCFPPGWEVPKDACHCAPRMYYTSARQTYTDRVILIGDCGVARLYKDGVGAAFRTARAAARTALFEGVSATSFDKGYLPEYSRLARDNLFGKLIFSTVHLIKRMPVTSQALLADVIAEQSRPDVDRRMSAVLWDVFTGSSSYRDIFFRALNPLLQVRFASLLLVSACSGYRKAKGNSTRPA